MKAIIKSKPRESCAPFGSGGFAEDVQINWKNFVFCYYEGKGRLLEIWGPYETNEPNPPISKMLAVTTEGVSYPEAKALALSHLVEKYPLPKDLET